MPGLSRFFTVKMIFQFGIIAQLIRAAGKNEANGVFEIIAMAHEIVGQPIQQFGMARCAIQAEVILRLKQTEAEITLPEADDDGLGQTRDCRVPKKMS